MDTDDRSKRPYLIAQEIAAAAHEQAASASAGRWPLPALEGLRNAVLALRDRIGVLRRQVDAVERFAPSELVARQRAAVQYDLAGGAEDIDQVYELLHRLDYRTPPADAAVELVATERLALEASEWLRAAEEHQYIGDEWLLIDWRRVRETEWLRQDASLRDSGVANADQPADHGPDSLLRAYDDDLASAIAAAAPAPSGAAWHTAADLALDCVNTRRAGAAHEASVRRVNLLLDDAAMLRRQLSELERVIRELAANEATSDASDLMDLFGRASIRLARVFTALDQARLGRTPEMRRAALARAERRCRHTYHALRSLRRVAGPVHEPLLAAAGLRLNPAPRSAANG